MKKDRDWKAYIKEVPNFPKDGFSYKDISPLLSYEDVFRAAVVSMGTAVQAGVRSDQLVLSLDMQEDWIPRPDYWIGVGAKGFIFASALAIYFGGGVVMCRTKGKLPQPTIDTEYNTKYNAKCNTNYNTNYNIKYNTNCNTKYNTNCKCKNAQLTKLGMHVSMYFRQC